MVHKTKTFDCVDMKHQGAELVRKVIENASVQEELHYWRKGTKELRRLQEEIKKQKEKSS